MSETEQSNSTVDEARVTTKKVTLSFKTSSKKVLSDSALRHQSITSHRDETSALEQDAQNKAIHEVLTDYGKQTDVIIPLIRRNQWNTTDAQPPPLEHDDETESKRGDDEKHIRKHNSEQQRELPKASSSVEQQRKEAVELILNSSKTTDPGHDATLVDHVVDHDAAKGVFQQMQMNKVPGIDDVVDARKRMQIDCAHRPTEPSLSEYERVPLSVFGEAMLRGMGWSKDQPIGNPYGDHQLKLPPSMNVKRRPRNLGLGAKLTHKEAAMLIEKKVNKYKQQTQSDRKRIAEIQSFAEPASKKRKLNTAGEPEEKEEKAGNDGADKRVKSTRHHQPKLIEWIRAGLKVRCVKQGAYFREKGVVDDVIDLHRFTLRMDKDARLLTLYETDVETVIPKTSQFVRVCSGPHKGQIACVLAKHKQKQCATVRLQDDSFTVMQCDFDHICAI